MFCYNFMAITDWTRTDLMWPAPGGGFALRFDAIDFAAYDLFLLERDGADKDYAPERIARSPRAPRYAVAGAGAPRWSAR